jgi:hypothetical protein
MSLPDYSNKFQYTDKYEIVRRTDRSDAHNDLAQELLTGRVAYSNVVPIDDKIPEIMRQSFYFVPLENTAS